mmetsp:Transcript_29472/g.77534  ORF Transcript_29472/g.77534 Transcript_29472/m.77534 type:complete len:100 (-) Transcript_29472:1149-1448(-)
MPLRQPGSGRLPRQFAVVPAHSSSVPAQASDVLDGPWAIAQQRADKAGVRLAEALLARAQVWTRHTHTQTRRDNKIYSCPVSLRCHVLQQGGCAWRMRC